MVKTFLISAIYFAKHKYQKPAQFSPLCLIDFNNEAVTDRKILHITPF
jgi:hypothetical protein